MLHFHMSASANTSSSSIIPTKISVRVSYFFLPGACPPQWILINLSLTDFSKPTFAVESNSWLASQEAQPFLLT